MAAPLTRAEFNRLVLGAIAGSFLPSRASGANPPSRDALESAANVQFNLAGPFRRQIHGVIDHWLLVAPERNPAMLGMFADRDRKPYRDLLPWSGEFAGKYLTACAEMLRLTGDFELRRKTAAFVARLVALQDEDGYLGPFPKEFRLTGKAPGQDATWDAWGHYHAMIGLLEWHDATGDARAWTCAIKIARLLCAKFLGPERRVADMGSPDQNQAIIHSVALLYRRTGEQRCKDLALELVQEFELAGAGDYLRTALAGKEFYATPKPRWESLHSILGLAELYRITGDERYRRAFEHIWWSIVKLDRHNNGGFSSGEQAVGNPYDPRPIETCCTIAWIAMSVEMLKLTGNCVVADELELSTLNSVVGLHAQDGSWSTYNTPMDGRRIPNTTDIAFQVRPGSEQLNCCSVNAARGFGLISKWGVMRGSKASDDAPSLVLNWFGTSTINVAVGDVPVSITQETKYPANDRVEIVLKPDRPIRFALKVRVPHWSQRTLARMNGEPVEAKAGTYLTIQREWKEGDRVSLKLDLRLRGWVGEREAAEKVSLYRGPLLLAEESSAAKTVNHGWDRFGDLHAGREKGTAFEGEFFGTGVKWFGRYFDDAGVARVSIDGKEVAMVNQYDPAREKPFAWEHKGLPDGKHTIRVEVSGEKSGASKDTWSNALGFGPPDSKAFQEMMNRSPLDLKQLLAIPRAADSSGALVSVEISDGTRQIALRDFGTAGRNGAVYRSWLRANGAQPVDFSRANPSRTVPLESLEK